jgi:hypothetical protein
VTYRVSSFVIFVNALGPISVIWLLSRLRYERLPMSAKVLSGMAVRLVFAILLQSERVIGNRVGPVQYNIRMRSR